MSIGPMLPQVRQLLNEVDAGLIKLFEVPREWLPAAYRGKRKMVSLESVWKKYNQKNPPVDPRSVSVKFDKNQAITAGSKERLATIENYRRQIESGAAEIQYDCNEDASYTAMLKFAAFAVQNGLLTPEDFEDAE